MSGSRLTPSPALQALLHNDIPAGRRAARLAMHGDGSPGRAVSRARRGAVAGSVAAAQHAGPVLARAHVILSMVCEAHHGLPATAVERLIHQDHGRR
jgi:hypothetical protein